MNFCSDCGNALNANARFCSGCGANITADGVETPGESRVFTKKFVALVAAVAVFGLGGIGVAYAQQSSGHGGGDPGQASGGGSECAASFDGLDQSTQLADYYPTFLACSTLDEWVEGHGSSHAAGDKSSALLFTCGDVSLPRDIRLSQVCREFNKRAYGG